MSVRNNSLLEIYHILLEELGPQYWWPAETAFEVVVGAVLTQQTKWANVEKAIYNLKEHGLLHPRPLAEADVLLLEGLVRCCGFYRQKASRLKDIASYFTENEMDDVFSLPVDILRERMLSLKGVGNETADSIILYAAHKPRFVIDAYTTRIMKCMGMEGDYMQLQWLFEKALPEDVCLYQEYHALIVEYSKTFCGRGRCSECLLRPGPDE
jgi:endonuclease-3 related protein